MSGLFGYLTRDDSATLPETAERIGRRLCHDGHHRSQFSLLTPNVAIGRMSIGVFNQCQQPAHQSDQPVWLFLAGELYHQRERRATLRREGRLGDDADDSELALQVYLRDGVDGLTTLEGAFTVAVWDARVHELLLVNDRFGLYPHFYARLPGGIVFAPEVKAVVEATEIPRKLDRAALAQYVRFQRLLGDRTWYEDVRLLPPASVLHYQPNDDTFTPRKYWDWDQIGSEPGIDFETAVCETSRLFQRAVDEMTGGPYRHGIYLSGGMDSRMILGFVGDPRSIDTFTFGATGCRDVVYAAEIARRAGSRHHWIPLDDGRWVLDNVDRHLALTEGFQSWIHGHGISTLARARELIDVSLSGWNGGTVFSHYLIHDDPRDDEPYHRISSETELVQKLFDAYCRYYSWPGLSEAEALTLFGGAGDASLRSLAFETMREEIADTAHYPPDRRLEYLELSHVERRSTQNMLVVARSALEVRCPYMDYDLVSFVLALPTSIRHQRAYRREIITRRMPRLAAVPYDHDDRVIHTSPVVYLPGDTWRRAKSWMRRRGLPIEADRATLYADYENYLRDDLRQWAESILFARRTEGRGFFDPAAVRAIWDRHQSGREPWTIGKIAPLITLEMVMRYFFDDDSVLDRSGPGVGDSARVVT